MCDVNISHMKHLLLQSYFNGSNTLGTKKICLRPVVRANEC